MCRGERVIPIQMAAKCWQLDIMFGTDRYKGKLSYTRWQCLPICCDVDKTDHMHTDRMPVDDTNWHNHCTTHWKGFELSRRWSAVSHTHTQGEREKETEKYIGWRDTPNALYGAALVCSRVEPGRWLDMWRQTTLLLPSPTLTHTHTHTVTLSIE